jgi:hypothetical protein
MMENRYGLVVDAETTPATGTAEREAAKAMVARLGDSVSFYKIGLELFMAGGYFELLDWLRQQEWLKFDYQVALFGGRRAPKGDGLIPDFVVWLDASWAMVWNVQGEYWHGETLEKDATNRLRMLGLVVDGARIGAVVELWEDDIYHKRRQTFDLAMAGMGMRG